MDISFRQIRSFLAVAQLGSFTQAATSLFLTQPALTIQIRNMEESLNVRLFDRNTRAVKLTRVGASLLPVFQRMVNDLDSVVTEARDIVAMRRGVVRIAVLPSVAASLLPFVIKGVHAIYPGAEFIVRDAIDNKVVELVKEGEVDIGVTGGWIRDKEVKTLFKKSEALKVIFPHEHPLGNLKKISVSDIAQFPLVTLNALTSLRTVVEEAFSREEVTPVTACEATYMMTVASMVSAGLGVAVLPSAAKEDHAFPDITSAPIDISKLSRTISIITLCDKTLPPMSQLFCKHLISALEG